MTNEIKNNKSLNELSVDKLDEVVGGTRKPRPDPEEKDPKEYEKWLKEQNKKKKK